MASRRTTRRRIDTISGHFSVDITGTPTTNLFPLNCSSNVCTGFRRLDNRLLYGRQASASQGYFMRQSGNFVQSNVSDKGYIKEKKSTVSPTPPMFSRLGSGEPQFARPEPERDFFPGFESKIEEPSENKLRHQTPIICSQKNEWSPRINVAESKCNYNMAVELPGVDIRDIRVEIDDKNLIVRGKRSEKWWNATGSSNDSGVTYHKREITPGQYQVVWPLPADTDKENISAEFM